MVAPMHDLSPSSLLIALLAILLPVYDRSLIGTTTNNGISIRAHSNVQGIRHMALQPLNKGIVLGIPEANFTRRVTRHNRPIRKTFH